MKDPLHPTELICINGMPQAGTEGGTVDEPTPTPQGLQEPEAEDIKTVSAGDTIYGSATSFEDLCLSEDLLKVRRLGSSKVSILYRDPFAF